MNHAAKYTKRPVTIEAVQYTRRFAWPDWFHDAVTRNDIIVFGTGKWAGPTEPCYCEIKTLEGTMRADENDWIIRGIKGEIYPCKPDIFEASYIAELESRPAAPVVAEGLTRYGWTEAYIGDDSQLVEDENGTYVKFADVVALLSTGKQSGKNNAIPLCKQSGKNNLAAHPVAPVVAEGLQAKLDRAERALIRAGFDDLGGQEWKPPLGKPPVFIEVHSKIEAAIPSLYGMWHKQLIANGAVMHEKLIPALRQFCHNDGSEGYVHAYDMEIVNREFSAMEAKMARHEGVNVFAELLDKLLSAKGLPRLTDEHIETWAWRTLTELFSQQEMKTAIRCEECAGTGKCGPDENPSEMDCEVCDGSGQVTAHQLTPASIDTPEFQRLLDDFAGTAIDAHACGNDCGTGAKRDAAETALIGYIDGRAAAEPMPASEAANLKKLCDQLDGMKRTMFLMPGTGQHYSYLLLEDVSAYVEEARKFLAAPAAPTDAKPDSDQDALWLKDADLWRMWHQSQAEHPRGNDSVRSFARKVIAATVEQSIREAELRRPTAAQSVRDAAQPTATCKTPLSAARHAVHNLKEFRAGRTTFPGEALGILESYLEGAVTALPTIEPKQEGASE